MLWPWLAAAAVLLVAFLAVMWKVGAAAASPKAALERFARQRDDLRRAFFLAAGSSGKPRGLVWKSIEWHEGMTLVRERRTRRLAALVGVTIAFEAVAGGEMEGVAAVGNLRHGSATFFYHRGEWHAGKTIFNLLPDEVLSRFAEYERAA
jgi:hypothetical protein